ncbi:MAG TPA: ethanolamine ammonia-lyase subunit EutC [Steroidobacteraceae bacterium]|nr:ethanolamine ammonia-lyase subunit EutC [Steroidobacteraceae bacterium]
MTPGRHPLAPLRSRTPARVALGHHGAGLPTAALLDFQLDHAHARDAVHEALDLQRLAADLAPWQSMPVGSQAPDRATYLQRPDLGRRLSVQSAAALPRGNFDVAFILADGLSARAVQVHAAATLKLILGSLADWRIAPLVIATQARVALSDEIGSRMGARLAVMLIGERPGLSSPDSLGIYLTFDPRTGRLDHERNCISNVRSPQGLPYEEAAARALWLLRAARRAGHSGVRLKEDSALSPAAADNPGLLR